MQRMRNNDECMLGGVMEEKRGMVRAVPLAGGRSPGRVRSSARVLESRTLSMAAIGMMSATTARSTSDPLDGQCMLTAVLPTCEHVRLSTAVQGDIPSTMHDLAMMIAVAHRPACAGSLETCGSYAIERESVATAHPRVRPWCQEARRALSCDENDRFRSTLATSCSC